jgi:DNA replication and repair protein RecF
VRVTRLTLAAFRSYAAWEFEPDPRLTVLLGPNAAGKTNAVEALQLVTACRSFREPRWEEVVAWGAGEARVAMQAEGEIPPTITSLTVTSNGSRTYAVDGTVKRRLADVVGRVPSVLFTPDDLTLVKGPAEGRRNALDELGDQLSRTYAALRLDYQRVLRQRNRVLKDEGSDEELGPWTEQLAALGSRLTAHRARLAARLAGFSRDIYSDVTGGEALACRYAPSASGGAPVEQAGQPEPEEAGAIEPVMLQALERRAGEERARKTTLVGPHRDDVVFTLDGRPARAFGSQGQQRSIALAWKLAELRAIEEIGGRRPVLLLDDVMSELDEARRDALLGVVREDIQTIVTTTNLGYFSPRVAKSATVLEVGRDGNRA